MRNSLLALAALMAASAFAQPTGKDTEGQLVNQSSGAAKSAIQVVVFYNASSQPEYLCYAWSQQPSYSTITVTAATNANPVVFTATAHGFGDFATHGAAPFPVIKITGATGNWAGINGVWKATPTSADAFSIPVDSTTFGTYGTAGIAFTTKAPRLSQSVWSIERKFYNAGGLFAFSLNAANPGGAAATSLVSGTTGYEFACSSRTSYAYQ